MNPFFSIIIPLYNREKTISRAINSILNQTFQDFELIVVDDASKDKSAEIVSNFQLNDKRIFYIRNLINQERCVTRNIGIEAAKGRYICFLDSDDYHLPHHLQIFHDKIVDLAFPLGFLFTSSWNETAVGVRSKRVCPSIIGLNLYHYFLNYTVNPQRWCVESRVAKKILFDPEIVICEDLDFSLQMVVFNYPIIQILDRSTVYVASADSFTHGDTLKWEKELFYLRKIFQKKIFQKKIPFWDKNKLLSKCYYFLAQKEYSNSSLLTIKYCLISLLYYPFGYKKRIQKDLIILIIKSLYIGVKKYLSNCFKY
jgi:glycosyltransferase involved in cell wall biosynthesis